MATNTKNLGLIVDNQADFYNVDKFNENFQKIDDFSGRKDNPHGVTADQVGAISRLNGLLESTIEILDTLVTKEYAGDWAWLTPGNNPFGYPLGTLCVVTNNVIQYAASVGVAQTIKPVYPTNNCGEIFTRSYYYGNEHAGGSEWTDWKKIALADEFLPIIGGTLLGDLWFKSTGDVPSFLYGQNGGTTLGSLIGDNRTQLHINSPDSELAYGLMFGRKGTSYSIFGEHNKELIAKYFFPIAGGTLTGDTIGFNTDGYIQSNGNATKINHGHNSNTGDSISTSIIVSSALTKENMAHIARTINGENVFYNIFGQHNKPTGTYEGKGANMQQRTINVGGIGNALMVYCNTSKKLTFVTPIGGFEVDLLKAGNSALSLAPSYASFSNGVLNINSTMHLNTDTYEYTYQLL